MTGASDPRALLRELEQHARKRFGQHFLARPAVVARMVRAAKVGPGDRVLEIGPGLGILTEALLAAGAAVTAIEVDNDLAARVARVYPEVSLVHADATRVDWAAVCPGEGWKVVANLPYNVGTGLVMDLARQTGRFCAQTVMLQAEVVDRMAAQPRTKAYGALTVQLAARAEVRPLFGVPPEAFVPPPKVSSTIVHVAHRAAPDVGPAGEVAFDRVVTAAFAARRKTLRNTLGAMVGKERAEQALHAAGVDPGARAETLDVAAFRALAAAVTSLPPA